MCYSPKNLTVVAQLQEVPPSPLELVIHAVIHYQRFPISLQQGTAFFAMLSQHTCSQVYTIATIGAGSGQHLFSK